MKSFSLAAYNFKLLHIPSIKRISFYVNIIINGGKYSENVNYARYSVSFHCHSILSLYFKVYSCEQNFRSILTAFHFKVKLVAERNV